MMAAETTSEAANANQRLLPMANTPLRTNSSLAPCGTYVAIFFDISCCVLPPSEVAGPRGTKYQGTIHDSTEACSPERAQMNARNTRLQTSTRRKMSPSLPCTPTAAAPMARFCGEIILPSTPPELLPAAISAGASPALVAAVTCRAPKSEFEEVSDPVTATPSQPRMGEISANAPPTPAIQVPRVMVCPDAFITNASASTAITVTMAHRS